MEVFLKMPNQASVIGCRERGVRLSLRKRRPFQASRSAVVPARPPGGRPIPAKLHPGLCHAPSVCFPHAPRTLSGPAQPRPHSRWTPAQAVSAVPGLKVVAPLELHSIRRQDWSPCRSCMGQPCPHRMRVCALSPLTIPSCSERTHGVHTSIASIPCSLPNLPP